MEGRELETLVFKAKACLFWKPPDKTPPTAGGGVLLCGSSHHGIEDGGKEAEGGRGESRRKRQSNHKSKERGRESRGKRAQESESGHRTYVDLTENDVNYAANYDEEIKHIPGITKVPLHRTS